MKKLFIVLCVVIMFFGVVGCPEDSNNPTTSFQKSSIATNSSDIGSTDVGPTVTEQPINGDSPGGHAVPEPATLVLLGSGLVGLAGVGRKKFFKKD